MPKKNLNSQVTSEGARTTGKGFLTVGLVSMAVKLYKADDDFDPGFKMVHEPCGSTINQKIYCPKCDRIIENKTVELIKGIELGERIIPFREQELEDVRAEASKMFEVQGFITEKDAEGFVQSGDRKYVGADPEQPCDGYRVMFASLVDSGLVGLVHYAQRGFEHLALLKADKALEIFVLRDVLYADQIRQTRPIPRPVTYEIGKEELDLSQRLIKSLIMKPEKIGNSPNRMRLQAFVDKKVAQADGAPAASTVTTDEPSRKLDSLFAQLKASLDAKELKAS